MPNKLIQILSHNESFVSNTINNARNQHHIILSLALSGRVENGLYNFFRYAKQLDALIDQILF